MVLHYIISHNYAKLNVESYDSLPLEKTLTFHNVKVVKKQQQQNYEKSIFIFVELLPRFIKA